MFVCEKTGNHQGVSIHAGNDGENKYFKYSIEYVTDQDDSRHSIANIQAISVFCKHELSIRRTLHIAGHVNYVTDERRFTRKCRWMHLECISEPGRYVRRESSNVNDNVERPRLHRVSEFFGEFFASSCAMQYADIDVHLPATSIDVI